MMTSTGSGRKRTTGDTGVPVMSPSPHVMSAPWPSSITPGDAGAPPGHKADNSREPRDGTAFLHHSPIKG